MTNDEWRLASTLAQPNFDLPSSIFCFSCDDALDGAVGHEDDGAAVSDGGEGLAANIDRGAAEQGHVAENAVVAGANEVALGDGAGGGALSGLGAQAQIFEGDAFLGGAGGI